MAESTPITASTEQFHDLSASIDTLPPRRNGDSKEFPPSVGGKPGMPIGRPNNGVHARQKSKTEFLDLADASNRLGTSPDISARLEQKRLEHERQRAEQKKVFEAQMRALQEQQESEERELLAASAPNTPPRTHDRGSQDSSTDDQVPSRSRSGNNLTGFGSIGSATNGAFREFAMNSKSVPGSRRHSGGEAKDVVDTLGLEGLSLSKESALAAPFASKLAARVQPKTSDANGASSVTSFLFDDEDCDLQAFGGRYLQMNTDEDKFPILVRRDSYPNMLSASSAALDLAAPRAQTPPTGYGRSALVPARGADWSPFDPTPSQRHSSDSDRNRITSGFPDPRASPISERGASPRHNRSVGARPIHASSSASNVSSSPQQEKRASFLSPATTVTTSSHNDLPKPGLNKPFPPSVTGNDFATIRPPPVGQGFGGYGLDQGFGGYGVNGGGAFGFEDSYGVPGTGDPRGQMYLNKPRRDAESNRFANIRLEDMQGDMFGLCKDQHGCRFLQKKLEEGDPKHRDMIFAEIYPHFGELMTDAFGNYLAQKAFEYCTDEQRDLLIESISGELVSITLNMHGTRAVQRIIDLLSTQRQVQSLIVALNMNVVTLIKDLNANHAIQKLLNHLPPEDNQFIFNSVAANCIEVATHRHGCCVLQRCIDHASECQRIQLVTEITYNALVLVQDPFANYVVQYVLDLNDSRFIEAIVRQFMGNVCALSMQKFSSNVVEKCIRVSDPAGRRALIEELIGRQRLERLLRDSFANYVVQTALDYADPTQRAQLVDNIRPILPMIRNTPYGKRIQSKISRESMDPLRGAAYHPALVSGGYFIAPPHMAGHPSHPHHVPALVDGRTGTPFHPQLIPAHAHPGAMAAAAAAGFHQHPGWGHNHGHHGGVGPHVSVSFPPTTGGPDHQQPHPYPPFM